MPHSHAPKPNEIGDQGHAAGRDQARFPDSVEQRHCNLVRIVTAAILDAIRAVGMVVERLRPATSKALWPNSDDAGRAKSPHSRSSVEINEPEVAGKRQYCDGKGSEFGIRPETTWLAAD